MTKERIALIQRITPWASFLLTVGGASYGVFISGNIYSYLVTLSGVAVAAFDRHLSAEKSKIEKAAREEAEARLDAITERVAGRTISTEVRNAFISSLRDAPKGQVRMSANMQESETMEFMIAVALMVVEAGYDVPKPTSLKLGWPGFGTGVEVPENLTEDHYAVPLIMAFKQIDPRVQIRINKSKSAGVDLIIGGKPRA